MYMVCTHFTMKLEKMIEIEDVAQMVEHMPRIYEAPRVYPYQVKKLKQEISSSMPA